MSRLHYAGVIGTIASGNLTNSATSHTFTAPLVYGGNSTAVPTLTGSDYFLLSILDTSGNLSEVIRVTAYNSSTGAATIVRGVEGTSGTAHNSGDKVTMGAYASDIPLSYLAATSGAGDINLGTIASFTDITGLSLSVPGVAGDKILITVTVGTYNTAGIDQDIAIVVAGTVKSAMGAANQGVNTPTPTCVQWLHTVAGGDISGGNVAIKAQVRAASGATVIYNNASHGPITATISAVNYH